MPFTLAHPAAVVPLRRFLVLSALVVGSLAPDFHYFFNLAPHAHMGHNTKGIFIFCLPVGLAVLWLFQDVMKSPLIALAPEGHQQRLAALAKPFRWGGAGRFTLIVVSLLLGAVLHLAWDAFTHERGLVVRNMPDLREPLEEFGTRRPLYRLLQHGSSLLGMALLAFWYWRWYKRTPPQPVPPHLLMDMRVKLWIQGSILALAFVVAFVGGYFYSYHLLSLPLFVGSFVVTFPSAIFTFALVFSLWWHFSSSSR